MVEQPIIQEQPAQGQQVIIQKEKASPTRSVLRIVVSIIIIVLIAALSFGVWWLIQYALDKGML